MNNNKLYKLTFYSYFSMAKFKKAPAEGEEVVRVRLPRGEEVLGILDRRLGGSRCEVRCLDGKTRICRIPGRSFNSLFSWQVELAEQGQECPERGRS